MARSVNKLVPMPAFADPSNPKALGGSINFGVAGGFPDFEEHPVEHSDDYGAAYLRGPEGAEVTDLTSVREGAGEGEGEERDSWLKADWETLAKEYGLPHSGTVAEIKQRVEEHEASLADEGGVE